MSWSCMHRTTARGASAFRVLGDRAISRLRRRVGDMTNTADIGLIGLAVMGQNLVLNMADHGYEVRVYNRTTQVMRDFIDGPAAGKSVVGDEKLEELVAGLASPRRVMLMVKAGPAVDAVIESLVPLLDDGDIIIDGGNSRFT